MAQLSIINPDMLFLLPPFIFDDGEMCDHARAVAANQIFKGWQKGESENCYCAFKSFYEMDSLKIFSHPSVCHCTGSDAFNKPESL